MPKAAKLAVVGVQLFIAPYLASAALFYGLVIGVDLATVPILISAAIFVAAVHCIVAHSKLVPLHYVAAYSTVELALRGVLLAPGMVFTYV